jgi:LysR family hydrogen peroxide-inducible transcriptional activator
LRLYLREEQTAVLIDGIWRGRIDSAIIALPYDIGNLKAFVLGKDRLLVACPLNHPFAGRATVQEEELRGERLLLLEDGHCLRDHVLTACRLLPGRPNEDLQGTSLGTLMQMVANGLGLTLLPDMAVPIETYRLPGVAVVPFAEHGPTRTIALVWRPGSPRESDLRIFGDLLLAHTKEDAERQRLAKGWS